MSRKLSCRLWLTPMSFDFTTSCLLFPNNVPTASRLSTGDCRPDCLKTHLGRKFVITYTLLIELTSWALSKVYQVRSSKVERLLASTAPKRFICLNTKARQGISHSHRLATRSQHLDAALIFIFGDQPKAPVLLHSGNARVRCMRELHVLISWVAMQTTLDLPTSEDLQSITPRQWQIIGRKFQEWVEIMHIQSGDKKPSFQQHITLPNEGQL
ncbi:hypothetical protein HRG_013181 [Hirsutella rhossiliensis]